MAKRSSLSQRSWRDRLPFTRLSIYWGVKTAAAQFWQMCTVGTDEYFKLKPRERPATLDDPKWGTHGFLTVDHNCGEKPLKLHYVAKGSTEKPLMLFVHGFPEFWYSWRHQLVEFGEDYRAVALDMRGYSESDKPSDVAAYHMSYLAADVKEAIKQLGYSSCILVAHDWGASIAFEVAMQYPEVVDKLVIGNGVSMRVSGKNLWSSKEQQEKSWYIMLFQQPWLPEHYMMAEDMKMFDIWMCNVLTKRRGDIFTEEDRDAYKYTFSSSPEALTCPINYYRAMVLYTRTDPVPDSNRVRAPTLVVWGKEDAALRAEIAELMCTKHCDDYSIRYIDRCTHWIQQERPETMNKFMRQFLNGERHIPTPNHKL